MAIRSIAQLKAWFKRGQYPTEGQFADWIDSFIHKEDKVPISSVEDLTDQLNGKYDAAAGEHLNGDVQALKADYEAHGQSSREQFNNIADNIEELEAEDERLNAAVEDIRMKDAAQDNRLAELSEADAALQTELANACDDIGKIQSMLKEGATLDEAKTALVELGVNYRDLYAVANTLKTFLQDSDAVDSTINRWQEIESFLQGITDTQTLLGITEQLRAEIMADYTAAIKQVADKSDETDTLLQEGINAERDRAIEAENSLSLRISAINGEAVQFSGDLNTLTTEGQYYCEEVENPPTYLYWEKMTKANGPYSIRVVKLSEDKVYQNVTTETTGVFVRSIGLTGDNSEIPWQRILYRKNSFSAHNGFIENPDAIGTKGWADPDTSGTYGCGASGWPDMLVHFKGASATTGLQFKGTTIGNIPRLFWRIQQDFKKWHPWYELPKSTTYSARIASEDNAEDNTPVVLSGTAGTDDEAANAVILRQMRDDLLAATDKFATADYPFKSDQEREDIFAYRMALRKLPEQPGFPNVELPTPPKCLEITCPD